MYDLITQAKRSNFARFYFLGDEDLLDVIGQAATNPSVIQLHLKKLFAGTHSVQFSNDHRHIVAICSIEGERVQLKMPVPLSEQVETWLNQLVHETQSTLRSLLLECLNRRTGLPDLTQYPSQILCLSEAVIFAERCEKAISSNGLSVLMKQYKDHLSAYTDYNREEHVISLKRQALVMDIIHYIDIIEQLSSAHCRSPNDWIWQKQLRYSFQFVSFMIQMRQASITLT